VVRSFPALGVRMCPAAPLPPPPFPLFALDAGFLKGPTLYNPV
jgi:hypothetical protein